MPQITKPNTLNKVWAAGGDRATPLDSKIALGWQVEIPPRQWFNWLDNRQDQAIAHFNQHGIPVWDSQTEYQAGKSYVQDPDTGDIYRCTQTHTGRAPSENPEYWYVAFAGVGEGMSEAEADARYLAKSQNLNDIPNKTAARANLGVYSTAQTNSQITSSITSQTLGYGSWQDVTSSRANGITYTNNTGRPIMVAIHTNKISAAPMAVVFHVNSLMVGRTDSDSNDDSTIAIVVPPNAQYRAVFVGVTLGVDAIWRELR